MNTKNQTLILLSLLVVLLGVGNILWGSVSIPVRDVLSILAGHGSPAHPSWDYIVLESRIPQVITASLCGAALSTCGLLLQTLFRNPLAGPNILGIDSGANLGVALVMLMLGGSMTLGSINLSGYLLVILAALAGACAIMGVLILLASYLRSPVMLLITGVIISYVTSSVISMLNFRATEEGVHNYIIWGMGNFNAVTAERLPLYCGLVALGLLGALLLIKPLDALLLGDSYARNLGVSIRGTRNRLLLSTGLLTAVTTAFCGPVSFIGLAVPHIARMVLRTSSHRVLMPGTMLTGATLTLLCNLLCTLPRSGSILPINVITPLIGAPVILYVILRRKESDY